MEMKPLVSVQVLSGPVGGETGRPMLKSDQTYTLIYNKFTFQTV